MALDGPDPPSAPASGLGLRCGFEPPEPQIFCLVPPYSDPSPSFFLSLYLSLYLSICLFPSQVQTPDKSVSPPACSFSPSFRHSGRWPLLTLAALSHLPSHPTPAGPLVSPYPLTCHPNPWVQTWEGLPPLPIVACGSELPTFPQTAVPTAGPRCQQAAADGGYRGLAAAAWDRPVSLLPDPCPPHGHRVQ